MVEPSGESINEVRANNATSQQSAIAMGKPKRSSFLSVFGFGISINWLNTFSERS